MTECKEVADSMPLIDLGKPLTMDYARILVRYSLHPGETQTIIDNVAERYLERHNETFYPTKEK